MEILTLPEPGKDAVPEGETAADTRVWVRRAGDTTTVREGAVTFMECGKVVGQAPSMEAGAELGVEQGIWNRTNLPNVMEQLEVTMSLALTQAVTSDA